MADNYNPKSIISLRASAVGKEIFSASNFSKYTLIVAPTDPVPLNLKIILDPS